MLLVGVDWAERHHDVCLFDEQGAVLAKRRITDGLGGVAELDALLADHANDPSHVVIGIETDRGLLVGPLLAAGDQVYGLNPLAVSRYRDRHVVLGAKSHRGDAKVLADLVRADRHNHRQVAGDSPLAEAVKVVARAQQRLVWIRQDQVNRLRSALREFYPGALDAFGTDLAGRDALAVPAIAPTPAAGHGLSHVAIANALRQAGRKLRVQARAAAIQAALWAPQLDASVPVASAYGQVVTTTVAVLGALNAQLAALEEELGAALARHPQAQILLSQPGPQWVFAALGAPQARGAAMTATAPPATATPRRCGPLGTGWSASCTAVSPARSSTTSGSPGPSANPPRPEQGRGAGGGPSLTRRNWPLDRPGSVVQVGQRCRPVKREGTAGPDGWMDQAAAEGGTLQPSSSAAYLDRA
jgi:transposase